MCSSGLLAHLRTEPNHQVLQLVVFGQYAHQALIHTAFPGRVALQSVPVNTSIRNAPTAVQAGTDDLVYSSLISAGCGFIHTTSR